MEKFVGTVKDMYGERDHIYPATDELITEIGLKYDFIFTREGVWFYISSSHNGEAFLDLLLDEPVEENDEQWKIVDAITGEIFKETNK